MNSRDAAQIAVAAIELLPIAVVAVALAYIVAVAYERWKQRTCARLARWYLWRIEVRPEPLGAVRKAKDSTRTAPEATPIPHTDGRKTR